MAVVERKNKGHKIADGHLLGSYLVGLYRSVAQHFLVARSELKKVAQPLRSTLSVDRYCQALQIGSRRSFEMDRFLGAIKKERNFRTSNIVVCMYLIYSLA